MSICSREIKKITLISILGNILLGILKILAGFYGQSQALLADGVHSLSDLSTDILIYTGSIFWSKPADKKYPYGHGRIEIIITLILGLLVFAAAIPIIYSSLTGIQRTDYLETPLKITMVIAFFSVIFKEFLYRLTLKTGKKINSPAVIANAWHHRSDSFSSIPVIISIGCAIYLPDWIFMDRIGAVIVGVILIKTAIKFIYKSINILMDRAAPDEVLSALNKLCQNEGRILEFHKIRTRYIGNTISLDMHIELDANLSLKKAHDISSEVKKEIIRQIPEISDVIIHIEPY
ncbi:MAG: cation diffusion facilitator family transporter [Candidatus Muiribacteriota bacterium]